MNVPTLTVDLYHPFNQSQLSHHQHNTTQHMEASANTSTHIYSRDIQCKSVSLV
jgi:hypothetical protein